MRILIAPDKFKGSLTSVQACEAMARGIRAVDPAIEILSCPVADGGEGSLDAIAHATSARRETFEVAGPLPGMRVKADVAFLPDASAFVELASCAGLQLLAMNQRNPLRTTTFGVGELLQFAADKKPKRIILGIGGSATCDAGVGIAQAWGASVRMINGKSYSARDRKLTGDDLSRVASIRNIDPLFQDTFAPTTSSAKAKALAKALPGPAPRPALLDTRGIEFIVACDVGNPLFGPDGAAHIFAPQKGATPADVEALDRNLKLFAERLGALKVANSPGAGAAGGVGFAMMLYFGAEMVSGAEFLLDLLNFNDKLAQADLVITGEGRLDAQTAFGKAPAVVASRAKARKLPCLALAGTIGPGVAPLAEMGVTEFHALTDEHTPEDSLAHADPLLQQMTENAVRQWLARSHT